MSINRMVWMGLLLLASVASTWASEQADRKIAVLNYNRDSVAGRNLRDLSPFHNDALGIAMEYFDPVTKVDDGFKVDWALIPQSESLAPENFIFSCDVKSAIPPANENVLYRSYISPFYLKDRALFWKMKDLFYPVYEIFKVKIGRDNRVWVTIACQDGQGEYKPLTLVSSKAGLKTNVFQNVTVMFRNQKAELRIDSSLEDAKDAPGPVRYRPTELYPGHINAMLMPRAASQHAVLNNLALYDLAMDRRPAPAGGIKIRTDKYLNFFALDEPLELNIGLCNFTGNKRPGTLYYTVVDHGGKEIAKGSRELTLAPGCETSYQLKLDNKLRGCFWIKCAFRDAAEQVMRRTDQYAVGRFNHDLKDVPDSSPFGVDRVEFGPWCGELLDPDVGHKWVRMEMCWPDVEPVQGQFKWERYDKALAYHLSRGRKVYVCVNFTPVWAQAAGNPTIHQPYPSNRWYDRDIKERENYLRQVVSRYKGKIWGYDIWGEGNANVAFPLDKYFAINKLTHDIVREIDPAAKLAGPSACRGGFDPTTERFLKGGAMEYWDYLDTHYIGGAGGSRLTPEESVEREIAGSRKMMEQYGKILPIIDGESGYPVAHRRAPDMTVASREELAAAQNREEGLIGVIDSHPTPDPYSLKCRDEITLSNYYVRRMMLCLANDVRLTLFHNVGKITFAADMSIWTGKHDTGVTLPAIAIATMAEKLSWADFIRKINLDTPALYGCLFRDNKRKQQTAVIWAASGSADVILNPDSGKVRMSDIWGNPAEFRRLDDGTILLTLNEAPVYLDGVGANIALARQALSFTAPGSICRDTGGIINLKLFNPLRADVRGKVSINASAEIMAEPMQYDFTLAPGATMDKDIKVTVASGAKVENALLTFTMASDRLTCRSSVNLGIEAPPHPVTKLEQPIVIDGTFHGWPDNLPVMSLEDDKQVLSGYPRSFDPVNRKPEKEWQGKDDLSGKATMLWDQDNLYLLLRVKDKVRNLKTSRTPQPFMSDGIELFIDGRDQNIGRNVYEAGVRHIRINPGDEKQPATVSVKPVNGVSADDWKIEAASTETPDGYILEVKIPADSRYLPELKMAPGRMIGFNIYLNDADGEGFKATIAWTPKPDCNVNPQNFGKLVLK